MILNDFSSTVTVAVRGYYKEHKLDPLDHKTIRAIVISSILGWKRKFGSYGQMVLCLDSKPYWREYVFPHYKKNRSKMKKKDHFDWKLFHKILDDIVIELKDNMPWPLIKIRGAEADDIIAVLARTYIQREPIMIVSADKDLKQLQMKSKKIKQYSPKVRKQLTLEDYNLTEHIIRGDSSDGIPCILADDDVFLVDTKRQPSIYQKFVESIIEDISNIPDETALNKYNRNKKLIDVDCIPKKLNDMILDNYDKAIDNTHDKVYTYLVKHRMRKFLNRMNEFK